MAPTSQDDSRLRFGWFSLKPDCLQCLNRAVWFLVFMSYGNFFQSMLVNGLMGTVVSTLEKRFDLSSSESSFIVSAYEIATVPMIIIVSYVGAKGHRPVWIAVTLLILGLSGFMFAIPHFTTPVYNPREASLGDNNLCRDRSNETACDASKSTSLSGYLALFIVARVFMAIGATPLYTMGVTYIDDVVQRDTFSLYVALFYGFGVLGPAVGLIGGGFLLNIFTDFQAFNPEDNGIGPNDPRWIGAWWLGFMIGGAALLFTFIPFAGYSRDLPGAADIRANKKSEAYANADDIPTEADFGNMKDLPKSLKIIVTNPTFMSLCLYGITDGIIISGFTTYGPKFVENQFSISPGFAGMMFGLITIPGGVGGTIAGGAIVKCFKLSCRGILRTSAVANFIILCFAFLFFITCENTRFAGVNVGYNASSVTNNLTTACNAACMCKDVDYDPICGINNIRYYSPCHAGCTIVNNSTKDGITRFRDCSCINGADASGVQATSETCTVASCKLLPLWLVLFFLVMFLTFLSSSLNISGTVRSVPNAQKSLAIGFQWLCVRIIGTVPGPPMFGATIDRSCILWLNRCGKTGSCLFYSNEKMALYIFLLAASVKVLALIFLILAWRLYKAPNDPTFGITVHGEVNNPDKDIPFQYVESVEYSKAKNVNGVISRRKTTEMNGIGNIAFEPDSQFTSADSASTYM